VSFIKSKFKYKSVDSSHI